LGYGFGGSLGFGVAGFGVVVAGALGAGFAPPADEAGAATPDCTL
jgi:hypothetical protein